MNEFVNPIHLRALPKVELHRHLDCSIRWSTLIRAAHQMGLTSHSVHSLSLKELHNEFLILEKMQDLNSVLNKFHMAQRVLGLEGLLEQIAFEAVEDAFNDGIRLLELRYSPDFVREANPTMSYDEIHSALYRGIQRAQSLWPIACGLIVIVQRSKPVSIAESVIDFVINNRESVIGIDLADSEENFDPSRYAKAFSRARARNLPVTVHVGEIPSQNAGKNIMGAVEILGASRIGHGVQCIHELSCINFLRESKILLEVCPWSNYLTQAFPSYQDHPVRDLLNAGVLVSINTDDPGPFGSTLTDEYVLLQNHHDFSETDFNYCNLMAANASFLPQLNVDQVSFEIKKHSRQMSSL